jgi:hypothetical protein
VKHIGKFVAIASAAMGLAACEPETVTADKPYDPQAAELANAQTVELPPAISASHTYRCKDNSLVYIDFYTNNTAQVRTEKGGTPTILTAPAAGQAYVAEGYSVSTNAPEISYTAPGKPAQSCKA